jgi:hypothetical protein
MTTSMELKEGSTVNLDHTFILRQGADNVPIEITFNSTWFWTKEGRADAGYKYFDVQAMARNIGTKETSIFSFSGEWEVTVDKGYVYEASHSPFIFETLRPEEIKTDVVEFEILVTTTPVEVRYYDFCLAGTTSCTPTFILDLRSTTIPVREELTLDPTGYMCYYYAEQGKQLLLNMTNLGLSPLTVTGISVNGRSVYDEATRIDVGQTVSIPVIVPIQPPFDLRIITSGGSTFVFSCGL